MEILRIEDLSFSFPQVENLDLREGGISQSSTSSSRQETCGEVQKETCGQAQKLALDCVTFTLNAGEILAVCGPSASGKSTLLRLLKPIIAPVGKLSGRIEFCRRDIKSLSAREQALRIGFVMQDPAAQICTDKVIDELAFGLESCGIDPQDMRSRIAEVSMYFGLDALLQRRMLDLSGGQMQLVNLAAACALRPDILVLDEPLAQLDPIARGKFLDVVARLNRELGITVVIAEHALDDVVSLADKVLFLDRGCAKYVAAPRNVVSDVFGGLPECIPMLPAASRISLALGGSAQASPDCACTLPLDVREGRAWLERFMGSDEPVAFEGAKGGEGGGVEDSSAENTGAEDVSTENTGAEGVSTRVSNAENSEVIESIAGGYEAAIRAHDAWFRYERNTPDVIRSCTFDIPRGAITALLGSNGSGKSTLLKLIARALKPYMGRIRFASSLGGTRAKCAWLPQDPTLLFRHDTVKGELDECLAGFLKVFCADLEDDESVDQSSAFQTLRSVFDDVLNCSPFDLSGGQTQILALLKTLSFDAGVICLDEPTKGVDLTLRDAIADLLITQREYGRTVIVATHDLDFVARVADCSAMVFDGSLDVIQPTKRLLVSDFLYTTSSRRMSRFIVPDAITAKEVISFCQNKRAIS